MLLSVGWVYYYQGFTAVCASVTAVCPAVRPFMRSHYTYDLCAWPDKDETIRPGKAQLKMDKTMYSEWRWTFFFKMRI